MKASLIVEAEDKTTEDITPAIMYFGPKIIHLTSDHTPSVKATWPKFKWVGKSNPPIGQGGMENQLRVNTRNLYHGKS